MPIGLACLCPAHRELYDMACAKHICTNAQWRDQLKAEILKRGVDLLDFVGAVDDCALTIPPVMLPWVSDLHAVRDANDENEGSEVHSPSPAQAKRSNSLPVTKKKQKLNRKPSRSLSADGDPFFMNLEEKKEPSLNSYIAKLAVLAKGNWRVYRGASDVCYEEGAMWIAPPTVAEIVLEYVEMDQPTTVPATTAIAPEPIRKSTVLESPSEVEFNGFVTVGKYEVSYNHAAVQGEGVDKVTHICRVKYPGHVKLLRCVGETRYWEKREGRLDPLLVAQKDFNLLSGLPQDLVSSYLARYNVSEVRDTYDASNVQVAKSALQSMRVPHSTCGAVQAFMQTDLYYRTAEPDPDSAILADLLRVAEVSTEALLDGVGMERDYSYKVWLSGWRKWGYPLIDTLRFKASEAWLFMKEHPFVCAMGAAAAVLHPVLLSTAIGAATFDTPVYHMITRMAAKLGSWTPMGFQQWVGRFICPVSNQISRITNSMMIAVWRFLGYHDTERALARTLWVGLWAVCIPLLCKLGLSAIAACSPIGCSVSVPPHAPLAGMVLMPSSSGDLANSSLHANVWNNCHSMITTLGHKLHDLRDSKTLEHMQIGVHNMWTGVEPHVLALSQSVSQYPEHVMQACQDGLTRIGAVPNLHLEL